MQFTTISARPGRSTTPAAEVGDEPLGPLARAVPHRDVGAAPSAYTAARAAPPAPRTSALRPAGSIASASSRPGTSVLSAWIAAGPEGQRVRGADGRRGRRRGVGERERRLLVRDRHVEPAEAGGGQRADGLREPRGRQRQPQVAPVRRARPRRARRCASRGEREWATGQPATPRYVSTSAWAPCRRSPRGRARRRRRCARAARSSRRRRGTRRAWPRRTGSRCSPGAPPPSARRGRGCRSASAAGPG